MVNSAERLEAFCARYRPIVGRQGDTIVARLEQPLRLIVRVPIASVSAALADMPGEDATRVASRVALTRLCQRLSEQVPQLIDETRAAEAGDPEAVRRLRRTVSLARAGDPEAKSQVEVLHALARVPSAGSVRPTTTSGRQKSAGGLRALYLRGLHG